jgi:hypothetical protein
MISDKPDSRRFFCGTWHETQWGSATTPTKTEIKIVSLEDLAVDRLVAARAVLDVLNHSPQVLLTVGVPAAIVLFVASISFQDKMFGR